MPRRDAFSEDWAEDKDLPQESDLDDEDDELEEMACPSCRRYVTEDTQKCPYCGEWIIPEEPSRRGWPRWLFVGVVVLMLMAVLRWIGIL
jgi:predicted nucleic acid-binding Zn ribbon protein